MTIKRNWMALKRNEMMMVDWVWDDEGVMGVGWDDGWNELKVNFT